jgi:hypothetical protein
MKTPCTQSGACRAVVGLLAVAAATACSGKQDATPAATPSAAEAAIPETASPFDALPEAVRLAMDKPFPGDFDELVKRRAIRAGVTFNRTSASKTSVAPASRSETAGSTRTSAETRRSPGSARA